MKIVGAFVAMTALVPVTASAWESSRNGPLVQNSAELRKIVEEQGKVVSEAAKLKQIVEAKGEQKTLTADLVERHRKLTSEFVASVGGNGLLAPRTVEYPYQTGARIGDGWDFISNKRVYGQCVEYGAAWTDTYQQADMNFTNSIDNETLSVALNVNTSAHASGSFLGIGGSAGGSFGLDTSYKFTSKDEIIVAHASVVNGATFITAQKAASTTSPSQQTPATSPTVDGVKLSAKALETFGKHSDSFAFRSACGDGFVAAIGTGADAYILYQFHHLDQDTRVKVSSSMDASGSIGGLFSAGGSFSSSLSFSDLTSHDRLAIYYAQNGGKIASLPVKLEEVGPRISRLPVEAVEGPRPLYVVVVPYSELPNWPAKTTIPDVIDLRSKTIRYLQRLASAYYELQNIIADIKIPVEANRSYFHDDQTQGLRRIDYAQLNDSLLNEIKTTEGYFRYIDNNCIKKSKVTKASCAAAMATSILLIPRFDDFWFLVQFPLPKNAIAPGTLATIRDKSKDVDFRKYLFSTSLYSHWVDRISSQRCVLFQECLDREGRVGEYETVLATLAP
jgi:hypothetical protein